MAVLLDGHLGTAGRNEVVWRGSDDCNRALPSGVYLYRLVTEVGGETRRMTLLK